MQARIFKPTKSVMQSGQAKTKQWILQFNNEDSRFIEPVMGWTGSTDMNQEITLCFATKEEAINYANKKNIDFVVIEPQERKIHIKSYADNFK